MDLLNTDDSGSLYGRIGPTLYIYDEMINGYLLYYKGNDEYEDQSVGEIKDIYIDKDIIWGVSNTIPMDSGNGFWWFSINDIDKYYNESSSYYNIPVHNVFWGNCNTLSVDSKHNFWIGTNENGLYKYDEFNITQYTETEGLPGNRIRYIEVDRNDIVWFIVFHTDVENSYRTLGSYDGNTFTEFTESSYFIKAGCNSLTIDHNNTKWIGTSAGVCRFDGETWTTFTTENSGLCDNKVNTIAVDSNNVLWFGTDNGVSKYTGEVITTSVAEANQIPESIPLITSYPNPFNPSTTIEFTLPESGLATITIYSIAGQKIRELTADYMPAGTHTLSWDGKDASGNTVSSGIYITRLRAGKHTATGRMVLMK